MAIKKYWVKLREPWKSNRELVAEINESLREVKSNSYIRAGGWNPKKRKEMEKWNFWDFTTGWIVARRRKEKEIVVFSKDLLRAILRSNIGEEVD